MIIQFVYSLNLWFRRGSGSSRDTGAGVFAFDPSQGSEDTHYSFRELTKTTQIPVIKI